MTVYKPSCKISIDGNDISRAELANIEELVVEEEINIPTMFYFRLGIYTTEQGPWKNIDLDRFTPGKAVIISLGYETAEQLVKGEITSVDISFSGSPYIDVRGYDKLHRLHFGRYRRSFTKKKDSQIAQTIAGEAGLSATVEATTTEYPYILQNNQSNYKFLLERAQRIGYEIIGDDGKLIFRKSKEDQSPKSGFTFEYGTDIRSFYLSLKAVPEGGEVEARGWDMIKKEEFVGEAKDGSEISKMGGSKSGHGFSQSAIQKSATAIVDENFIDKQEAENVAKAFYNRTLNNFIVGEGSYLGTKQIRIGNTIEITKIGTKFSGNYYVTATTHILDNNGYITKFKVRKTGI